MPRVRMPGEGPPSFGEALQELGLAPMPAIIAAQSPRAVQLLKNSRRYLPERMWRFLARHPREIPFERVAEDHPVFVRTRELYPGHNPLGTFVAPDLAGSRRLPAGVFVFPDEAVLEPITAAHELTHAAQYLSGMSGEPFPGLAYTPLGVRFMEWFKPGLPLTHPDVVEELLPQLVTGRGYHRLGIPSDLFEPPFYPAVEVKNPPAFLEALKTLFGGP